MSHYLIEQIAALGRIEVRDGQRRRSRAEGEDGHLARLRVRDADGGEEVLDADACFVFIGAAPRTDWLDGVVARDERGFILAGPDAQVAGWRARARPVPAGDHASPACSWPATCARARSSASPAPSARARWPCRSSTSTSSDT